MRSHCPAALHVGNRPGGWSEKAEGKGSFAPTGADSPTCLPSDLQDHTGSRPGQRSLVVSEVLGLDAEGPQRERRGREGSLSRAKWEIPHPFRQGQSSWFAWGFGSSPRSHLGWRSSVPPGALASVLRGKVLKNSQRIRGEPRASKGSPCRVHQMWGPPIGWGATKCGVTQSGGSPQCGQTSHPRQNKGDNLLNTPQGNSGQDSKAETVCPVRVLITRVRLPSSAVRLEVLEASEKLIPRCSGRGILSACSGRKELHLIFESDVPQAIFSLFFLN